MHDNCIYVTSDELSNIMNHEQYHVSNMKLDFKILSRISEQSLTSP